MADIYFVDTTFRDGHTSLWASSMKTDMILPVAPIADEAGFVAAEVTALSYLKKAVRDLGEDPWERTRKIAALMRKTRLRAITGRHMASFQISPRALTDLWLERLAAGGIHQARVSDPSNTPEHWRLTVDAGKRCGLEIIVNLIFSISPKHTDAYYAERARAAAAMGPYAVCLKDPGGLLTPERTETLVPAILRAIGDIPFEFHTHCNTGLGPLCALSAIRCGARIINTATPPLADGSSNPSVYNVAKNARILGHTAHVQEEVLLPLTEHFKAIAQREGLPVGTPQPYDAYHYLHQVPGGMVSNFRFQLAKIGMQDRIPEILEEAIAVRRDLGFPIMVTPYSQFVGAQAAMNILSGERYAQISDEVIHYVLGHWGEEEAASVDPELRERIRQLPRARELRAHWHPVEGSLRELREKFGAVGLSDDDFLLAYVNSAADLERLKKKRAEAEDPGPIGSPLKLLTSVAASHLGEVSLTHPELTLRMHR